jgi:hypothetical protein
MMKHPKRQDIPAYGTRVDLMVQRVETGQGGGVRIVAAFEDGTFAFIPVTYLIEALNKTVYDVLTGQIPVQPDIHNRTRVASAPD